MIPQIVVWCLVIAATSASSVARQLNPSSNLHKLYEIHPLLRIRRQSGTGGLCVPDGGYCTKQYHCCSGSCLTFSYKCVPASSGGTQVDLVSMIIDSTSSFGGSNLENRFGENDTAPICAKDGEYCQMSSQCCSQRCLSFSYKCVPNHSIIPPVPAPGQPSLVASIPQNVITIEELISNRFGEPDSTTNSNGGVCLANGISCTDSNRCCSKYCAQATLNTRVCIARSNEVPHTPDGLPPRGPSVDSPNTEAPPPNGCQAIGAKCYIHDECCSRRCHGFLHQCVT